MFPFIRPTEEEPDFAAALKAEEKPFGYFAPRPENWTEPQLEDADTSLPPFLQKFEDAKLCGGAAAVISLGECNSSSLAKVSASITPSNSTLADLFKSTGAAPIETLDGADWNESVPDAIKAAAKTPNPEEIKKCAAALGMTEEDFKKKYVPTATPSEKKSELSYKVRSDENGERWLEGFNAAGEIKSARLLYNVKETA